MPIFRLENYFQLSVFSRDLVSHRISERLIFCCFHNYYIMFYFIIILTIISVRDLSWTNVISSSLYRIQPNKIIDSLEFVK